MNSLDNWAFFDRIYCISLDGRFDRREEAKKQFAKVGLLDRVEFVVVQKHPVSPKEGCYQSHIACMRKAIAADSKHILIFEDDILFKGFRDSTIQEGTDFLKKNTDWDIMFLGCIVRQSRRTTHQSVVKVKYRCLSHAYAINRRFVEEIVATPWQGVPYDVFLARMDRNFYAAYPSFAFQSSAATDNSFCIDLIRRLLGGLAFIQRANEIFQRYKLPIIASHFAIIAALLLYFSQ